MNVPNGLERWFEWLVQTSWQAAVLAVLILLAQWLLRKRLSGGWRHGLWLLLVVRLLMPMTPSSAVSIFNLAKPAPQARATLPGNIAPRTEAAEAPAGREVRSRGQDLAQPMSVPVARTEPVGPPRATAPVSGRGTATSLGHAARPVDWLEIAAWAWLAGALALALRFSWLNWRFGRRLAAYVPMRDEVLGRLLRECSETLGVRQPVVVIETEEVESPAMYGLWRKRLLLPDGLREQLSDNELRHVLRHELAHIKRRDPELNFLVSALQTLHWFNPVLWFAFGRMRADRELATDELALAHTQNEERGAYGETLLKVLEALGRKPVLPGRLAGVIGIGESKAQLGDRIRAIARGSVGRGWRWAAAVLAIVLAGVALTSAREEQPRAGEASKKPGATAGDKATHYAAAVGEKSVKEAKDTANGSEADTNCASVISVVPANGAQDVAWTQELRIRFDRPMNPYNLKLEWVAGGFQPNGTIHTSEDRTEFVIPVRLTPGQEQTVALNRDPQREMWARMGRKGKPERSPFAQGGFKDANGVIANEFRWSFSTKAWPVKEDAPVPRLVDVSPASGPAPLLTFVELTFDQAMRPPEYTFPYLEKRPFSMGGPSLIPGFEYDPKAHRFTVPAVLRPDDDVRLTLKGFYSADGVECEPIVLHYQTGSENLNPKYRERVQGAAKDPRLRKLLSAMKAARARLNSGIETVQTIQLGMGKEAFNSIEAKTATFKWEGKGKAYADITGPMMTAGAFILGSDGVNCWLYSENEKGEKRLDQTPVAVTEQSVYLVDPFDLGKRSIDEVLATEALVMGSNASLEGHPCYRVERWEVSRRNFVSATQMQWWIDQETLLPRQIVSYSGNWCQITRFDYKDLNQPLPASAFEPPAAAAAGAKPLFFGEKPAPGEQRFLIINDGSGGRMSGRLGYQGPGGRTSSGLN